MVLFYGNDTKDIPSSGEYQPVDRVYAIRFSDFTDEHSIGLDKISQSLPEFMGYDSDGIPYWFGVEDSPPFLSASAEPSNLLVYGMLSSRQWLAWDMQF